MRQNKKLQIFTWLIIVKLKNIKDIEKISKATRKKTNSFTQSNE